MKWFVFLMLAGVAGFIAYDVATCDDQCRLKNQQANQERCKPRLVATAPDGVRLWYAPCNSVYFSSGGAQWSHTVGKSQQTVTVPSAHE